jgi:hypothetical protein
MSKLGEHHIANFQALSRAFEAEDVALVMCRDRVTGADVPVICTVVWTQLDDGKSEATITPFAKLFTGNPYDEVDPAFDGDNGRPN